MSVFSALVTGVSGLNAQSQALATISDNIANVNTVGYKRVITRFSTLVTQSNARVHSPGGVSSNPMHLTTAQGLLQATGGETDIGIEGAGFFVVNKSSVPAVGDEYLFTRAGQFTPDSEGYLKNTAGMYLQGWGLDANGNLPTNTSNVTTLTTINLSNITGAARATTAVSMGMNLPANATTGEQRTTQVTMYDSLGVARSVTLNWTKTSTNNQWELSFTTPGGAVAGVYSEDATTFNANALDGSGVSPANRVMVTFDSSGNLNNMTYGGTSVIANDGTTWEGKVRLRFNYGASGASATQNIDFNFGAAVAEPVTPALTSQVTQVGTEFDPRFANQDGVAPGSYSGINITNDGTLYALFSNGETRPVYRIALANFPAATSLEAKNGNSYAQTANSGAYILSQPANGGYGRIAANSLEASKVDIAEEFSNMILTQRAYSANTKVISTADNMLEELIRTIS